MKLTATGTGRPNEYSLELEKENKKKKEKEKPIWKFRSYPLQIQKVLVGLRKSFFLLPSQVLASQCVG